MTAQIEKEWFLGPAPTLVAREKSSWWQSTPGRRAHALTEEPILVLGKVWPLSEELPNSLRIISLTSGLDRLARGSASLVPLVDFAGGDG